MAPEDLDEWSRSAYTRQVLGAFGLRVGCFSPLVVPDHMAPTNLRGDWRVLLSVRGSTLGPRSISRGVGGTSVSRGLSIVTLPTNMAPMRQPALKRGLNVGNAQDLLSLWKGLPPPRSIITSPPYLDMHDYGNASKIGARGQGVEDYLILMSQLFRDCHQVSAADATFWLVAGTVRRNGRLVPLPDRLAVCAENTGWTLREAITWDKQKALPWTHHGELRDITEQVLLFSKADNFRFDATELRSPIPNSIWWRRYPERYSPNGAMPTNLWSIPIPTQGSWAGIRTHFCPFPEELTYRMLSLTTVKDDTVLDPLAGIGSVPAMADAMGRVGYGLELTAEYERSYEYTARSAKGFLARLEGDSHRREDFRQIVIQLRLLKFAKHLGRQIKEAGVAISWVRTAESHRQPRLDYYVVAAQFDIVVDDESAREAALSAAYSAIERPPLSKFGIDANLVATVLADSDTDGFWYSSGRFWIAPETERPTDGEPHVVARFKPEPDRIDDTPYA